MNVSELELDALKEFLDVVVKLKQSGLLGMLKELATDPETKLSLLEADKSVIRLAGLIGILMTSLEQVDDEKMSHMRLNLKKNVKCSLEAVADTKLQESGKENMMQLLNDPYVQKAIVYVLSILRNFGKCIEK